MEILYVENIYSEYINSVNKIKSERKISDGLIGFGRKDDSYPCHDEFYQKISDELMSIVKDKKSEYEVFDVLMYIYQAPLNNKDNISAYWMMIAVHSLTECLFPLISGRKAEELLKWYTEAYPRYERLPNQEKMLKVLKKRSCTLL